MYEYKAIVRRVIDGDTIVVDIDLGFNSWLKDVHLRLNGIDAPEIRAAGTEGEDARDYIKQLLIEHGNEAIILTQKDKTEKYGRYLAEVYVGVQLICINHELVRAGHAVRREYAQRSV